MSAKTKIEMTKTIAKLVVGTSVSSVIVTIIHQNTETFKPSQKAQLYIGAYVIGAMVAKQAGTWTDEKVDQIVVLIDSIKEATKSATK